MHEIEADVVVIGSGIAGLTTALAATGATVHVVTKATLGSGANSFWAQGGLAAALSRYDSPKLHAEDTIFAGAGLTEPEVTTILTEEAEQAVRFLSQIGAKFDLDHEGEFQLAKEAAHRRPRVIHANKDATGQELMRALAMAASQESRIKVFENHRAIKLVLDANGSIAGAIFLGPHGFIRFNTSRVVLATGGSGQLFRYTTNPPEACGEGLALAARAGAVLADMEFVQFHPTALLTSRDPLPLMTEALRGAGAQLRDGDGQRFMVVEHELAELAPRDVVARGVWKALDRTGHVVLDTREAIGPKIVDEFPTVYGLCLSAGVDPVNEPIPVVPAAHYHMGGVAVDLEGRSTVGGLWACGEVSSTGVHGANRLASNSLLEAVVFGKRVGRSVLGYESRQSGPPVNGFDLRPDRDPDPQLIEAMRRRMWDAVGLIRAETPLHRAVDYFREIYEESPPGRTRDRARICWVMAETARARKESRGAHYRSDYPQLDPELKRHSEVTWSSDRNDWKVDFADELVGAAS